MVLSRRLALLALGTVPFAKVISPKRPIRLGGLVCLHSEDPRELARERRKLGYSAAVVRRRKRMTRLA
jgi:hypothetical protein